MFLWIFGLLWGLWPVFFYPPLIHVSYPTHTNQANQHNSINRGNTTHATGHKLWQLTCNQKICKFDKKCEIKQYHFYLVFFYCSSLSHLNHCKAEFHFLLFVVPHDLGDNGWWEKRSAAGSCCEWTQLSAFTSPFTTVTHIQYFTYNFFSLFFILFFTIFSPVLVINNSLGMEVNTKQLLSKC